MCYSARIKWWNEKDSDFPLTVLDKRDAYRKASEANPKRFPPRRDRIFPAAYGPVIYRDENGAFIEELMRYGAYPPHNIANSNAYTTFNARRDNLKSHFWSAGFMKHHGFVALEAFYEWVNVGDLLKAGVVTMHDVKKEFEHETEIRKLKLEKAGKAYKPTPTETKDPRLRKIVIEFKPDDGQTLLVPVIFSFAREKGFDGTRDKGFAIITDEPTPEIRNAGHDRSPVILERAQIMQWLDPRSMSAEEFLAMLQHEKRVTFRHKLAVAA